jgi:hypothetical protein
MEVLARARNLNLQALAADAWEELWREAKEAGVREENS